MHLSTIQTMSEHHWLQQLVYYGEQLDHAEEAKLNELVAAHQRRNN